MDAVFQRQCWQPWLMKGHAWYATHATWRSSWNRAFPEGIGCCNRNLSSRILPFFDIREDFQSLMNVAKDCRCDMQTQVAQVAMSVSNESVDTPSRFHKLAEAMKLAIPPLPGRLAI